MECGAVLTKAEAFSLSIRFVVANGCARDGHGYLFRIVSARSEVAAATNLLGGTSTAVGQGSRLAASAGELRTVCVFGTWRGHRNIDGGQTTGGQATGRL